MWLPWSLSTTLRPERSVVFIVGGVSYAETEAAYSLAADKKREVIIGGTSLLMPQDLLDELAAIGSGGII